MKPDALSRALNGLRGFSSIELARIADRLGADLHWLVTGRPDPHRVEIAARHDWDETESARTNTGRPSDEGILEKVVDAYGAAFPDGPPPSESLPDSPARLRALLGEGYVRQYGAVVQDRLGVDVFRLPGLTTDYSLTIGSRAIVILATTSHWYRSHWSLAHELAHLALGHHNGHEPPGERDELPANRYAAQLLLPEHLVLRQDWQRMDERGLAEFLWQAGVSTLSLKIRLTALEIQPSAKVAVALERTTPGLMRDYADDLPDIIGSTRQVTRRQQESSARTVPSILVDALQRRVEIGEISPQYLAWALDVPVDEIDFPEPYDDDVALADAYGRMLEDRPSSTDVREWLATTGRSTR